MKELQITLSVNGENRQAQVSTRMTLVDCLRDVLRLTGTHVGCEHGIWERVLFFWTESRFARA